MTDELQPRRRKKNAYIRLGEVYLENITESVGDCWVAITDDDVVLAVGTDIASVSQAAKHAGYWIADQTDDAA